MRGLIVDYFGVLDTDAGAIELVRDFGETRISGQGLLDAPAWHWGSR